MAVKVTYTCKQTLMNVAFRIQTVKSWSNALHVNRHDAVNNDLLSDVIIGHVMYS